MKDSLVPCPDRPCDERCIWCMGSGWIAPTTLAIYELKRKGHDTDKTIEAQK